MNVFELTQPTSGLSEFYSPQIWGDSFITKKEGTRHFSIYLLNEKEVRFRDLTVLYNIFIHIASMRFLIY